MTLTATLRALLAPTVAMVLAACGPGVSGTGTDSVADAFQAYGASSLPLCSSDVSVSLDCPQGGAAVAAGTGPVVYVDSLSQARVSAAYLGQTVRLDQRCTGLNFVGEWGLVLGGGRFFGIVTLPGEAEPQAAALTVQVQADGTQTLELRSPDNRVLLASTTLRKASLPLAAAQCPG